MFTVLAIWLICYANPASARILENWPYDKLLKEADLVIVAKANGTIDTDDKPTDPQMKEGKDFVGRTSTLKVLGTLKGKAPGDEIKVLHFRLKDGFDIPNGPCLVSFRTKSVDVKHEGRTETGHSHAEYLLFLKKRTDGRYEPVSGQYDPVLSIREMFRPPTSGRGSND